MSEVKVRITAQNETQTGFQSVLSDAKKTASEVKKTFSQATTAPRVMQPQQAAGGGKPFSFEDFYDDAINKAEQQIEANLAKRKAAREAAAQAEKAANADSESSIMSLVGRFAILAGAAVLVGKAISEGFQRIANAFQAAAEQSKQFASSLTAAGTATSLDGAISGFKSLNAITEQTKATLDELQGKTLGEAVKNSIQGSPGQLFARSASFVGVPGSNDLQDQIQRQQEAAREMLSGSLGRQAFNAEELLGTGGNTDAIRKLQSQQQNANAVEDLKNALKGQDQSFIDQQIESLKRRQAAESALTEQIKARAAADAAAAMRQQNAESGMTSQQLLAKEQAALASLDAEAQKSGRYTNEAALEREKKLARIAAIEKSITAENERQIAAQNAVAQRASDMRAANAETAAIAGMSDQELLARQQEKLAGLDAKAMESGRYSNADQVEREQIAASILSLEERIKRTREQTIKSAKDTADARAFDAMSPAERQAELDRQMAEFQSGLASGALTPQAASEQAARLMQMFDATNQAPAGFQGSAGSSAFQRIGFATNEFFDTRTKQDPTEAAKRAAKAAEKIAELLGKMQEPIVLNPTYS